MIEPGREEKLICGEENIVAFNDVARRFVPGFRKIAKELLHAGMIPGLRGSRLIINPSSNTTEKTEEKKYTCQQCANWIRDTVGDGTVIGTCKLNSRSALLKWPNQAACKQIKLIA